MFIFGFIGSFLDTIGMVAMAEALSTGPAGPIAAICSTSTLFMVVIEALKNNRLLTMWETIGFVLGMYGNTILSTPEFCEKYCFCWCVKKRDL
jgi:drug/metabolite transporter (DMT)-like permease